MRYIGDKKTKRSSVEERALAELRDVHAKPTRAAPKKKPKKKPYRILP